MKTIFKSVIALLAVVSLAACSDVPMPYDEPGTNKEEEKTGTYLDETFASDFGKFTNVTVKGNAWAIDYNTAKATGYNNKSKKTTESEAYLVSSVLDLSKSTAAYLQFDYILRYVRAGQTENKVLITDSYSGNPTTTTWTDITGTLTEGSDWTTFLTYKKNIPAAFLGKSSVVVALMYSCTTTSSTIEIKNLIMKDGKVDETGGDAPTPTPTPSGEAKGSGTQADPYNAAGANKAAATLGDNDKKENVYVSGTVSQIKSFNSKFGEINYYISDDGTTNGDQFYVYGGLGKDGAKFASESDLKVGQKVVVVGTLINFKGNTPEFQYGSKIVSIDGEGTSKPDEPSTSDADISVTASSFGLDNSKEMGTQTLSDGTKLVFDAGTNKNAPKYYKAGSGTIRMYPGNSFTVTSSKNVAKLVIVCDTYNNTDYTAEGKMTSTAGSVTLSGLVYTVSDINSSSFTIANGHTGKGGKSQLRIKSIAIYYAK